jgi:hypothetical protein
LSISLSFLTNDSASFALDFLGIEAGVRIEGGFSVEEETVRTELMGGYAVLTFYVGVTLSWIGEPSVPLGAAVQGLPASELLEYPWRRSHKTES